MPLVSVLIPSRKRFDRLQATIASFLAHQDRADFEIRVRFDDDDLESISRQSELPPCVHVLTGKRPPKGYDGINYLYTELAESSQCPWIWIMNDDAWLESGSSLTNTLRCIPTTGILVQPSHYQLNNCRYAGHCSAFPIAPNRCWHGHYPFIMPPADAWLYDFLVKQLHWSEILLPGVTVWHNWEPVQPNSL